MTTFVPTQPTENGGQNAAISKQATLRTPTVTEAGVQRSLRQPQHKTLPPIAAMLARPLLLAACIIAGTGIGFFATGTAGFQSSAAIEFTVDGNDISLVQFEGQTLATRVTTDEVFQRAALALSRTAEEVAAHTAATWRPNSTLVDVTASGPTRDVAVGRANAVARATVDVLRDAANSRLVATASRANSVLRGAKLPDAGAEAARRSQVGSTLAERQDALTVQSDSVFVAAPAKEAESAGLTSVLGSAVGLAAGLFAGCVIAVLLGSRGLRAWSANTLRRLAPDTEVLSPSRATQVAGQIVQDGETYVAIVATRQSDEVADEFAADLARILSNHGKTVTTIHPPAELNGESAKLLRADVPKRVHELVGTDVLIVVVEAGTESATMLEGRSGFRTIVLLRRYRTPVADVLSATDVFKKSSPVLVLAK